MALEFSHFPLSGFTDIPGCSRIQTPLLEISDSEISSISVAVIQGPNLSRKKGFAHILYCGMRFAHVRRPAEDYRRMTYATRREAVEWRHRW